MADAAAHERIAGGPMTMTVPHLILSYVVTQMSALTCVVIYAELRQRRFKPTPSEDRIFRCQKCGCVYTDDPDVDRSRCSQCGQMNEAIEF
jgi:hypothetical protein